MAIVGPLGMRVNLWQCDSIPWHRQRFVDWKVTSPVFDSFRWTEPVAWADCCLCPKDEDGHIIPGEKCTCGIYATTQIEVLTPYFFESSNRVVYLVEGLGTYIYGSKGKKGFRASGVEIVGIVQFSEKVFGWDVIGSEKISKYHRYVLCNQASSDFFNVPIIPIEIALEMIKIQWERLHSQESENE